MNRIGQRHGLALATAMVFGLFGPLLQLEAAESVYSECADGGNLVSGKPAIASSEESAKNNLAAHAVDGKPGTRWCAANASSDQWIQVDLLEPKHIQFLRIQWEQGKVAYRYRIEGSLDARSWMTLVDASTNKKKRRVTPHKIDGSDLRYLKVVFLGSSTGAWGSLWELEAYAGKLPALPANAKKAAKNAPSSGPATIDDVQAPPEFEVKLFGTPPEVNYPVCITAASTGEVFVGVDEQGSLGKTEGGGRVLRCIDSDGDGVADDIKVFARMDHPRGLIYDNGTLWVLHPPFMTVYHDDDGDGVADREKRLITGISSEFVEKRGADHTTNGIRMGIDGWIYIAVGDFGFPRAVAADGTELTQRGGGIVRIRPDGSEMEVYCTGLRNILDVCIDPYLNIFTRDNTNDGGGWNTRLTHIVQSGEYGYPSLYMHFADEIMPALKDYGGGSGCGGMYLQDARWPQPFADALFTCDWGRSIVYIHQLPANGPSFDAHQETFVKIPRPTDIDVDGSGRMYISSWKGGQFKYDGPNIGFVAQLVPRGFKPEPFPDLSQASDAELIAMLAATSAKHRQHAQLALLARDYSGSRVARILALAHDSSASLYGRVAAIFTASQLGGVRTHPALLELVKDPTVREFALRALSDRKSQLADVPVEPFIEALSDSSARVRCAALIGLGRMGHPSIAPAIVPLAHRPSNAPLPAGKPLHSQPEPQRVIQHLAVEALVALQAADACVAALDGPYRDGALWALRGMHSKSAVNGMIAKLRRTPDPQLRKDIMTALIRLYHREGEYRSGWWGTRPDTSGPYFDRKEWSESPLIAQVLVAVMGSANADLAEHISVQLARHKVDIEGLPQAGSLAASAQGEETPIVVPKVAGSAKTMIGNMDVEVVAAIAASTPGDVQAGKILFSKQGCVACHTFAEGQKPKGPHLVDIGKRYKRAELIKAILEPNAVIAQGFDTYMFDMADGEQHIAFVVSESADVVSVRSIAGVSTELPKSQIAKRTKQKQSMMPIGLVGNLAPAQLADMLAYLESLE